jgi:16S rRNA (uracil1498-N3)-methyltransferase
MRKTYAHLQRLIVAASQQTNEGIVLTEQQQHYLHRVLRLQAGDQFIAVTADGWWLAELRAVAQPAQLLQTIPVQTELPIALTLLIALPKNGMDDVVRQATEIGVARIQPILSQRTLLNPSVQKLDRWRRIAQEAAEQSERQMVPEVLPPLLWQEVIQSCNMAQAICYICEARGDHPHLLNCLLQQVDRWRREKQEAHKSLTERQGETSAGEFGSISASILIAVGAEGGWTPTEIQQAIEAGYQPVTLGSRILRSVTAPLVALSVIASVLEAAQDHESEKIDKLKGNLS